MNSKSFENMHKLWLIMNPAATLWAIVIFQIFLGLLIHMVVLSSDLNWHDDQIPVGYQLQGEALPVNLQNQAAIKAAQ